MSALSAIPQLAQAFQPAKKTEAPPLQREALAQGPKAIEAETDLDNRA